MKKAQWQTSLGFGSMREVPQSRRHSFADVPPRGVFGGCFVDEPAEDDRVNGRVGSHASVAYLDINGQAYHVYDDRK